MEIQNNEAWKKKHGDKADALFAEIAMLGGFGKVGGAQEELDPNCVLDLRGVLDPENKAIDDAAKARIKAIIGGDAPKAAATEDKK